MDFAFTHTQEALGRAARKFFQSQCSADLIRQLYAGRRSGVQQLWGQAAERGFIGALAPKTFGGGGLSIVDIVPILQEVGRALAPGPLVETLALIVPLLSLVGTQEQKQRWLPAIAAGKVAVAVALTEQENTAPPAGIQTRAVRQQNDFLLSGIKAWVVDADVADLILLPARAADAPEAGITLFLVPADAPGITIEPVAGLDRTRHYSHIRLDGVKVGADTVLGQVHEGWTPLTKAIEIATVALCGTMIGGAERVLETAAEYAKTRQQYGTVIGKFQGIKHKCAEMLVQVESAKSATYYAAWAVSSDQPCAVEAVSMAKNYVSQAYSYVSSESIQIHGALGFTWECEAHWYLKRAKANEVQLGSPRAHRERIAASLGW